LVRPKLFGRSVHMHEGVVFIAIIIAVLMEGILGALVVVPVLASIGVIGKYFRNRLYKLPPFEGKV
jgi:predicted PurR-regulated permease PerM